MGKVSETHISRVCYLESGAEVGVENLSILSSADAKIAFPKRHKSARCWSSPWTRRRERERGFGVEWRGQQMSRRSSFWTENLLNFSSSCG